MSSESRKNKLKPSEIRLFKMICGNTVICQSKKTTNGWIFTFPLMMTIVPAFNAEGKIVGTDVIFRDWMDGAEDLPITVESRSIVAIAKPSREILGMYLKEYMDIDDEDSTIIEKPDDIFGDIYLDETEALEDSMKNAPDIFSDLPPKKATPSNNGKDKNLGKSKKDASSGLTSGIPRQEQITNEDELDDFDGKWRENPPNFPK